MEVSFLIAGVINITLAKTMICNTKIVIRLNNSNKKPDIVSPNVMPMRPPLFQKNANVLVLFLHIKCFD